MVSELRLLLLAVVVEVTESIVGLLLIELLEVEAIGCVKVRVLENGHGEGVGVLVSSVIIRGGKHYSIYLL